MASGNDAANRVFAIETLADRKYIGTISLHNVNWLCRHAELGMLIGNKECWGRGYGSDAVRILLRLAFDKVGLHRVHLHVFDFNQRAISCYEKCGFRREGLVAEDRHVFWTTSKLATALAESDVYRCHIRLGAVTPVHRAGTPALPLVHLDSYRWRPHCKWLVSHCDCRLSWIRHKQHAPDQLAIDTRAARSYCAFFHVSEPINLTPTFEKKRCSGLPSAVPRCSVEKVRGPTFL